MQLIKIKPAANPTTRKKKGKPANAQETFEKYWRLVEKSQRDKARLVDDLAGLRQRYEAEVLPTERELNEFLARECFHLMHFLDSKGLSKSTRMVLIDWLTDNVDVLTSHPFYPGADKEKIVNAMLDCMQRQSFEKAGRRSRGTPPANAAADAAQPNLFDTEAPGEQDERQRQADKDEALRELEELMKDFLSEDEWQEFKRTYDPTDDEPLHDDARQGARQPGTRPDAELVRPESINLLFRRLAKVLHPDKELDETRKIEKHQLMSQLLQARANNDLPALLALHRQHLADEPLSIGEDELKGLVAMLKHQLEQLAADQQQLIAADPVTFAVYHWYYGKTPGQITTRLKRHLQEHRATIQECRYFIDQVKTAAQLRSFLRARGMD